MKKTLSFQVIFLITVLYSATFSQESVKTWTETTVQDFSDNLLTNLVVMNDSGGEVQFPHPFVKTVDDYNDNTIYRFIAKDSAGNFVRSWAQDGKVFVRKYAPNGTEITGSIIVNDDTISVGSSYPSKVAMLNDGRYIVIWNNGDYVWYGQVFEDDSVKAGGNFRINEIRNEHPATAIANNTDNTFLLFYTQRIEDKYKLHIQKRDINGNQLGESKFLNPDDTLKVEISPTAVGDENGFWVGWDGANGPSSWDLDLYLQHFNYDGTSDGDIILVNDDLEKMQGTADLCLDNHSNLFVVWRDERDEIDLDGSGQFNIYGQIFSSNGNRIGKNIRINSVDQRKDNRTPDIVFNSDEFQISWLSANGIGGNYLTYVNKWKFEPMFWGEMISSDYDCSPDGVVFQNIFWDEIPNSEASIKFQIRTGKTLSELNNSNWYGPDENTEYYNSTGEGINDIHNGDRYVQYKAVFNSSTGNSPTLNSISINYTTSDTVPPIPPSNLTSVSSHAKVTLTWNSNDEQDLLEYKIYRGTESSEYDMDWEVVLPEDIYGYEDTSAQSGTKYYYSITALDSSRNESGFSNEVSATAYGINIYVSSTGGSGGDGSINDPFNTIQLGIDAAFAGDSIRILAGTYNDAFTMKNRVSIIGSSAEECIINTSIEASDNCVIKGLTISKSLTCNSASPIIVGNIFRGTSETNYTTITLKGYSSPSILKNFIFDCSVAITSLSVNTNIGTPLIKNNIIKADDIGIDILLGSATIINNTIMANSYGAIRAFPSDTIKIENNILIGGVRIIAFPPELVSETNYNDIVDINFESSETPPTNIHVDPEFVDVDLQDYHLLSSSPCVDAGDPDLFYNDVDGSRNDMGAYGGPDPIQSTLSSQLIRSIYVSSLSGYPGDTVLVFVNLNNTAGFTKGSFILEADHTMLKYINVASAEATDNFEIQSSIISEDETKFLLTSSTSAQSGFETILKIKYVVNNNLLTGDATPLSLKDVSLYDVNLQEVYIRSITNGAFIVNNINESEYYLFVDSKATNLGDGSRENPFNTIMKAVDIAEAGDTIFVYGGNYYGSVIMKEGITLVGSGAAVTYISASGDSSAIVFNNINQAEVSRFTIKGDENLFPGVPLILFESSSPIIKKNRLEINVLPGEFGITLWNNSNAILEQNYIKGVDIDIMNSHPIIRNNTIEFSVGGSAGISCREGSGGEITHNTFKGIFGGDAISINNASLIVKNNFLYCNNGGVGLFINNTNDVKIYNNIVVDLGDAGSGILISNSSGNEIINNSIVTHEKGIEEQNSGSIVYNNIVINNNNFGLKLSAASTYDYNDVWNNLTNYSGMVPGSNDISFDPLFVDTTNGDYRLSLDSPCKDFGNPDMKYNDPDGTRNDIGAFGGPYADSSWVNSEGSSLAIDSVSVSPADTIEIKIMGEKVNGIAEFDLTLSFDPSLLNIISTNTGRLTKSFSLERINLGSGATNFVLKSNSGIINEEGELIELKLAIITDQLMNTFLHFDSAFVKDEETYLRRIFNLKDGKVEIVSDVEPGSNRIPVEYSLFQNYPNPFNPTTTIKYNLPKESDVKLTIYNILGEKVTELVNEVQKAGAYDVKWNAGNIASGIYLYRIKAGNFVKTKKLILLK